jgi:cell division protein ZapA (FtsZ GTPase activity inhibitor)
LQSAAGDIKSASETLVGDLKDLGKPDTKAGQEAKDAIDQLSKEVEQDVQEMQSAVDKVSGAQGAVTAATSVAATLSKMGTQIGSAASKLDSADPDGELKQAFRDSSACKKLTSSSS